jgi:hypothetical protein
MAGRYAYRFTGFDMAQSRPWSLVAVGQFRLMPVGPTSDRFTLAGRHSGSIMPIQGTDSAVNWFTYTLNGVLDMAEDGNGSALIDFNREDGYGIQQMTGSFFVVSLGAARRLWLASKDSWAETTENGNGPSRTGIAETVSGEAVYLGP